MMCGSPGMLEELRVLFETRASSKAATTNPVTRDRKGVRGTLSLTQLSSRPSEGEPDP